MYFMFESFHRRPLESKILAYTRIAFAVSFTILFFVYCGYLVNQIKFDNPLLRLSTEHIADEYEVPDVEVCAQNTTLTFVRCDLMYMNWSIISTPDCYRYIRVGSFLPTDTSRCYLFESNGTIHYGVKDPTLYAPNATQIRRVDIYWKIDSLQNISAASIGIPAITMMLYDTRFSRWNNIPKDMIPQQAIFENEMAQGNYRSTSTQNHTSTIFFTPSKYRAIRPDDTASLMGFEPPYVDIYTITATQLDWPINVADNTDVLNGVYHGLFSVQLAKTTYEVQTEQRQHTLLSAVALVGGAYGVMVTMYTLMFGMVRHSPWGAVHQLPLNLIRGYDLVQRFCSRTYRRKHSDDASGSGGGGGGGGGGVDDQGNCLSTPWKTYLFSQSFSSTKACSASTKPLAQGLNGGGNDGIGAVQGDGHPHHATASMMTTTDIPQPVKMAYHGSPKLCNSGDKPDSCVLTMERLSHLQNLCERLIDEQEQNNRRSAQLENHLSEMQEVLREYYINMDYLDCLRDMRRRRPTRSWIGRAGRSMSNGTLGGWLLAGEEEQHHHQQQHRS